MLDFSDPLCFGDVLRMVAGRGSVDFHDYVQDQLFRIRHSPFIITRLSLSPGLLRRLEVSRLPKEVFDVEGTRVSLTESQRAFIIEFFQAMGVLDENMKLETKNDELAAQQEAEGDAVNRAP